MENTNANVNTTMSKTDLKDIITLVSDFNLTEETESKATKRGFIPFGKIWMHKGCVEIINSSENYTRAQKKMLDLYDKLYM